jgi:hypothetical protein
MHLDREVPTAYEALGGEFELARELIAARVRAELTQAEVAESHGHHPIRDRAARKWRSNAECQYSFEICQGYAVASHHQAACRIAP